MRWLKHVFVMLILLFSLVIPEQVSGRWLGAQQAEALQGLVSIDAGEDFTCALTSSGGVKCWGINNFGQLGDGTNAYRSSPVDVVGLTSGVAAISVGRYHACALTIDGVEKCWGSNFGGKLGNGQTTPSSVPVDVVGLSSDVAQVATGGTSSCALQKDGAVMCWGSNANGELGDGTTTNRATPAAVTGLPEVAAVSGGGDFNCALTKAGGVKCWGGNWAHQLGDGTTNRRTSPVDVIGLTSGVIAISAGYQHSCALATGGNVSCWGDNQAALTNYPDLPGITDVATWVDSCVVTSGGQVKCWNGAWGDNRSGELGNGTTTRSSTPVDAVGLTNVTSLASGTRHSCAIANGQAKCWGNNTYGALGNGKMGIHAIPVDLLGLTESVTGLSHSQTHACAVTRSGAVKCWGDNSSGQLGNGTTTNANTPVDVVGLTGPVTAVFTGYEYTCTLTNSGAVQCWGGNDNGQLGDGTTTESHAPVAVSGLTSGVKAISLKYSHACALMEDGSVRCWGWNYHGQLGDGSTTNTATPVNVIGLSGAITQISTGFWHTCALTNSGGVKCWGENQSGQLGDGTTTERLTPVDVSGLTSGVVAIAAGGDQTCALTDSGSVKCWGRNWYGEVGDGTTIQRNVPADVSGLTSGVAGISATNTDTCAVLQDGAVKCWGGNVSGQLGDGTMTGSTIPVNVSGMAGAALQVSMGNTWPNDDDGYACALLVNDRVKCWGAMAQGQLGTGEFGYEAVPVDVIAQDQPRVTVNYPNGGPGSFFTITGEHFPPGAMATVTVNGHPLVTDLAVNPTGGMILFLNTEAASTGTYTVMVSVNAGSGAMLASQAAETAATRFTIEQSAPLRIQEGGGQTVTIPPKISVYPMYMPNIVR